VYFPRSESRGESNIDIYRSESMLSSKVAAENTQKDLILVLL